MTARAIIPYIMLFLLCQLLVFVEISANGDSYRDSTYVRRDIDQHKISRSKFTQPAGKRSEGLWEKHGIKRGLRIEGFNFAPKVKKSIPTLVVNAGETLRYKIPFNTFYDQEDGDTPNLRLELLTREGHPLPFNSWITFDPDLQKITLLPPKPNTGRLELILKATDSGGKLGMDIFDVLVRPPVEQHRFGF